MSHDSEGYKVFRVSNFRWSILGIYLIYCLDVWINFVLYKNHTRIYHIFDLIILILFTILILIYIGYYKLKPPEIVAYNWGLSVRIGLFKRLDMNWGDVVSIVQVEFDDALGRERYLGQIAINIYSRSAIQSPLLVPGGDGKSRILVDLNMEPSGVAYEIKALEGAMLQFQGFEV